jgi:pimeloyl-ACP methyl ester carboxylesterase
MPRVEPFIINVHEAVLSRIMERVREYRWPAEPDDSAWQYGVPVAYMKEACEYWLTRYDWRNAESALNRFQQFVAEIEGCKLHFFHERSGVSGAFPLLLLHGWPGSVVEFTGLIPRLAHPDQRADGDPPFDVVVVSLPGFGFSDFPLRPLAPRAIAGMMDRLMTDVLGYDRYMVHGSDWGSMIAGWLGFDHSDHCCAVHWTMMGLSPGGDTVGLTAAPVAAPATDDERDWFRRTREASAWEFGYANIQATKPQTLSYALSDSPVGVAAWILEKFHGWTDRRGQPVETLIPRDTLLTNVMLYLVNDGFGPASWMYRSLLTEGNALPTGSRIEVPVGMAAAAFDVIPAPPRSYVEKACNLIHWTQLERGGHFLALEQPDLMLDDVRAFARRVASLPHSRTSGMIQ